MSDLVQQRWPDGLKERVDAAAGPGKRTEFTVRAVQAALGNGPGLTERTEADPNGADRKAREVSPQHAPAQATEQARMQGVQRGPRYGPRVPRPKGIM